LNKGSSVAGPVLFVVDVVVVVVLVVVEVVEVVVLLPSEVVVVVVFQFEVVDVVVVDVVAVVDVVVVAEVLVVVVAVVVVAVVEVEVVAVVVVAEVAVDVVAVVAVVDVEVVAVVDVVVVVSTIVTGASSATTSRLSPIICAAKAVAGSLWSVETRFFSKLSMKDSVTGSGSSVVSVSLPVSLPTGALVVVVEVFSRFTSSRRLLSPSSPSWIGVASA